MNQIQATTGKAEATPFNPQSIEQVIFDDLPFYFHTPTWEHISASIPGSAYFHLRRDDAEYEVSDNLTEEAQEYLGVEPETFISEESFSCYVIENDNGIFAGDSPEDLPSPSGDEVIYEVEGYYYEVSLGALMRKVKEFEATLGSSVGVGS